MARAFRDLDADIAYQEFICHMRLQDAAHVVKVGSHPVAVLLAGQFQAKRGLTAVHNAVQQL